MSAHAQTHTTMKSAGAVSQSVSLWFPVGEDTMRPQDVAQLHNHELVSLAEVKTQGRTYCHTLKEIKKLSHMLLKSQTSNSFFL